MRERSTSNPLFLAWLALLLVSGGCRGGRQEPPTAASERPPEAEESETNAERGAIGIHNPDNAPELIPIAERVAQCDYDEGLTTRDCSALEDLRREAGDLPPPLGLTTLLNLLEDESPSVRFAAAKSLRTHHFGEQPLTDSASLDAALKALWEEQEGPILAELGGLVSRFRLAQAGKTEEVLKALRSHPRREARIVLVGQILFANREVSRVFEAVAEIAREDQHEEIRSAALGAFWNIGTDRRSEIVALWREALSWPQARLSADAAYLLGNWHGGVEEAFEEVLAETARRADDLSLSWEFLAGLERYVRNDRDFVTKEKVFDVLAEVAQNNNLFWNVRNRAMTIMENTGDERLQETLTPLTSDPEMLVAKHAADIIEGESPEPE